MEFPNGVDVSPLETLRRTCSEIWGSTEPRVAEIEGQGIGNREDSYDIRFIRVYQKIVHLDEPLSDSTLNRIRQVSANAGMLRNMKAIDLTATSEEEAADVIHQLFVTHFALRPYNELGHFNVAAYWV
jgi:hypothetical protein